jgi:nicotinamide-nucleotide amidase
MNAVIITVGSELLLPGHPDTNAAWLIDRLLDRSVPTLWRAGVGDDVGRIAALVDQARRDASIVILTGGLGPTDDDRTREAVAAALARPLERDGSMAQAIDAMFAARGRVSTASQHRQADRPAGCTWIANPIGSAPGLLFEKRRTLLAALPGVPAEMRAMFTASIDPRVVRLAEATLARRTLRIAGRPESWVDDRVGDLYRMPQTETTILASAGTVELLLTARGVDAPDARRRLDALDLALRDRLGVSVFGTDDESLASVVLGLLSARRATVAVAESCTGGMLGAALTDVPGASVSFRGGVVCYADELKLSLLGVGADLLRAHGAVSEAVAQAMARGARHTCGADYALAITGIAGPDGGTPEKPVGTVHIALDDGREPRSKLLDWPGDRALIRRRAVAQALDLLRTTLIAR